MSPAAIGAVAALAAICVLSGGLLLVAGLRRSPSPPPRPQTSPLRRVWDRRRDTTSLLVGGLIAGVIALAITGWPLMLIVVPAAVVGLPRLLAPTGRASVDRLDAMDPASENGATPALSMKVRRYTTSSSTGAPAKASVKLSDRTDAVVEVCL